MRNAEKAQDASIDYDMDNLVLKILRRVGGQNALCYPSWHQI